jgi:hypothetical protein
MDDAVDGGTPDAVLGGQARQDTVLRADPDAPGGYNLLTIFPVG